MPATEAADLGSRALQQQVRAALAEDVGSGDITAALIAADKQCRARILSKDHGILCGTRWAEAVFALLDPAVSLRWHCEDGARLEPGTLVAELAGPARAIMTGERTALNFLQTLSGTATASHHYAGLVAHTGAVVLDTRKTLPGLRAAQKYAVSVGGARNHRMGLYDAFLIKENHISACGGIEQAVGQARRNEPGLPVEVEVQDLEQLAAAIAAGADTVMLDNFTLAEIQQAVTLNQGRCKLEASGGIDEATLVKIAETGVDYVSIGALTKHCHAVDLTLLLD